MTRYYLYDSYTDTVAEFAKKKDNRKRNALIAAGTAGAGALGAAGYRYGGAAVQGYRSGEGKVGERLKNAGSAAKSRVMSDAQAVRNYDYKGAPGRAMDYVKGVPSRAKAAAGRAGRSAKSYAGMTGNTIKAMTGTNKGRLALAGAGLGAAALVGGGGLLAKRAMDRRRKNRNSIRGRVRALLGR